MGTILVRPIIPGIFLHFPDSHIERSTWRTNTGPLHQSSFYSVQKSLLLLIAGQMRDIYEIRERSSRMYHWSALTLSQITIELPWNVLGSSIFFFCFFWTVGFPSDRAGFTYLMYSVSFPFYYTTLSLAVGSLAPTSEIGNLMYSLCFSFVLILYVHLLFRRRFCSCTSQ